MFHADEARMTGPTIRAAFQSLDHVDLERMFQRRVCVMRSVPRILNGPFRVALRIAVQEILDGVAARDVHVKFVVGRFFFFHECYCADHPEEAK